MRKRRRYLIEKTVLWIGTTAAIVAGMSLAYVVMRSLWRMWG